MSVYFQSGTDDGGFASRGLALLGDSAAVMPRPEDFHELRSAGAPSDVATIRRGSMTSVPAVPGMHYTDTRTRAVHTLNVRLSDAVPQVENRIGAAA